MPKVKINNSQGLVQENGGGVALFGATETLVANATAANAQISATTSVALCTSADDAHHIQLPSITGLTTGHTIVISNVDQSQEFDLEVATNTTRINGVAATPVKIDVKEKTVVTCVYSGAANPGWIATVGDQATVPA